MSRRSVIAWVCAAAILLCAASWPISAATTAPSGGSINLWLPGETWALRLEGKSYVVNEREITLGAKAARFFGEDRASGVLVSGFIEPASREGDARVMRQVLLDVLKRSAMRPRNLELWEEGGFACAQFTTAIGGFPDFRQKSLHAYAVRDQCWIDVHLSTMDAGTDLKQLVGDVSFLEDYTPDEQDRSAALAPIHQLEKQLAAAEKSPPAKWKSLALKLASAYTDAGQIEQARQVLLRGLTRYPDHPLFHYSLACADAKQGNGEAALLSLRQAWRNRKNLPPDELLPDPLQEPSFASLLKQKRYRQAISEISRGR